MIAEGAPADCDGERGTGLCVNEDSQRRVRPRGEKLAGCGLVVAEVSPPPRRLGSEISGEAVWGGWARANRFAFRL